MRVRIWIEGNARGRTLRFVFGPRRRRRLTARVIPLLAQTVGVAACGLCDTGHEREHADRRNGGPRYSYSTSRNNAL